LQPVDSCAAARRPPKRLGPKKISLARLPVTGGGVFGREEDLAFLDEAWANQQVNVVTIVAWAGVGKSSLVIHWLRRIAAEQYRSAQGIWLAPAAAISSGIHALKEVRVTIENSLSGSAPLKPANSRTFAALRLDTTRGEGWYEYQASESINE
jgi:hypothetical protein